MQAVVVHETGGPEVLRLEEVERPGPAGGEVLLRVQATSVNPVDWKRRRSLAPEDLPAVLGRDISGTVELSRAEGFSPGDEVFGFSASGGYAEYSTAAADAIARKPDGLSHDQAAALPVAGLTAWQTVNDVGRVERGQTALIAGAAGGVGHFAVQFAKLAGARVIGTGSASNRDFVLGLGADDYVDYTQQDVADAVRDVDFVLDAVGGETTPALVSALGRGAIVVTIASAAPEEAAGERGARAALHVTSPAPEELARIAELVAAGEVRVEISERLPLTEIRRAHELSEAGHTRGKIVLLPGT